MNKIDEIKDKLWSAIRKLLDQGTDIEKDYTAGAYKSYEEFSARLDAAARERIDWLYEIITPYLSHGITEEECRKLEHLIYADVKWSAVTHARNLGLITSSREPIAESEHTIRTLAEDQKDIDPAVNKMVNEKFWELVGEAKPGEITQLISKSVEPESLVKAREKYTEYKNWKYRIDITYEMFVGAQDNYIRELEAHYCKEWK